MGLLLWDEALCFARKRCVQPMARRDQARDVSQESPASERGPTRALITFGAHCNQKPHVINNVANLDSLGGQELGFGLWNVLQEHVPTTVVKTCCAHDSKFRSSPIWISSMPPVAQLQQ